MFKQLNLASDKLSTDSPANKLRKYCDKYKNTANWGKKIHAALILVLMLVSPVSPKSKLLTFWVLVG